MAARPWRRRFIECSTASPSDLPARSCPISASASFCNATRVRCRHSCPSTRPWPGRQGSAARRPGGPRGGNRVSRPGPSGHAAAQREPLRPRDFARRGRATPHAAVRWRAGPIETFRGPSDAPPRDLRRGFPLTGGDGLPPAIGPTRLAFAGTRPPRLGHCDCWAGFDWRGSAPLKRRSFRKDPEMARARQLPPSPPADVQHASCCRGSAAAGRSGPPVAADQAYRIDATDRVQPNPAPIHSSHRVSVPRCHACCMALCGLAAGTPSDGDRCTSSRRVKNIVDVVLERAATERLRTVTRVVVEVGAAAGVDPEALRFCFDAVAEATAARAAELVIIGVSLRAHLVVLNKCDLLPYVPFDVARFEVSLQGVNPAAPVLRVSATRGDGCWPGTPGWPVGPPPRPAACDGNRGRARWRRGSGSSSGVASRASAFARGCTARQRGAPPGPRLQRRVVRRRRGVRLRRGARSPRAPRRRSPRCRQRR